MASKKDEWLAWIARNPIQVYMERAKIGTAAIAAILLVSRQIVYRWLDGQTIPAPNRIQALEDASITTARDYAAWWAENPNPPSTRSKSGIDRERIRALLEEKSEVDPITGCKIYCGAWAEKGIAIVRIGRRTYSVQMAALWVAGEVELYDRVYAYRTCKSPACWCRKHIKTAKDASEGMRAMHARGVIVPKKHRGIYLTERRRDAVRILLEEGRAPKAIAEDTGVAVHLIKRIAREMEREPSC